MSTATAATGNPNIILLNSPLGYVGTLGRTANSSLEVQLSHPNHYSANYLNHLSKEYISPLEQSNIMKTHSSNEALSSDDNVASYPSSANAVSHGPNNTSEDAKRAVAYIAHIELKIRRTKELIKEEQVKCNENVNEYLKLSANAESSQKQSIKTVFEKNNQKSAQRISRYQKKMKRYDQNIKDIKERGIYTRHTRERLRDVGTNIKEGISGLSGGVIEGIKSGIHTAGEYVHLNLT